MKKRWFSFVLAFSLLCALLVPAYASFDTTTRESVAMVRICLDLNAGEDHMSWGTGFFVGETGRDPSHLITNYHVIENFLTGGAGELRGFTQVWNENRTGYTWLVYENPNDSRAQYVGRAKIRVYYDSGTYEEAYIVDSSQTKDVAVLKLAGTTSLRKPIPLSVPDDSMVGSTVFAVGYPGLSENLYAGATTAWGISDVTVTRGAISRLFVTQGTGRADIQIDCDIKHGNSGGPLVNERGEAIGINTWSVNSTSGEQANYAINISEAITLLNRNGVVYAMGAGGPAPATEPPAETNPPATEPPAETNPPATEPPAEETEALPTEAPASEAPVETAPPASDATGGVNVPLIAGIVIAAVVVIVLVALLLRKDKGQAQAAPPSYPPAGGAFAPTEPPNGAIPVSGGRNEWRLQCTSGAFAGRRFAINGQVRIGRNPGGNDLVYPDGTPGISGRHCVVALANGQVTLTDLGSSYGTFLAGGRKLTPNQPVVLRIGDRFYLGAEKESFVITGKGGSMT